MTGLVPLLMMWLWSQRSGVQSNVPRPPSPPSWPTRSSPPPPIPAFTPNTTPAAPSANTGTPLHELHAAPPEPAPAHVPPKLPRRPKPKPVSAAVQRARRLPKLPGFGVSLATTPAKVASVSDLQSIVNRHGGQLKRDGLYGPKTASAWSALARKRGLPSVISRTGPKTAKVSAQTFDQLSMPAIP